MQISADGLEISYGDYIAVKEMNIVVKKGEITTIIGPNGSGKSTVLKALTRLHRYKRGSVMLNSQDINSIDAKEFARHVGVLPQRHLAPPDFKVKDLVSYGRMPYQKWYTGNSDEDERVVEWAMRATNTWQLRDKSINECSGGEAQRVWIATVLSQNPEILFLDEPTTYLDISHQLETMRLVKSLNRDSGIGVVMVLHDLAQALEVSDKIVVIKDGKKYAEGTPSEVITDRMMREVYNVDCDILHIPGRKNPVIAYKEIL